MFVSFLHSHVLKEGLLHSFTSHSMGGSGGLDGSNESGGFGGLGRLDEIKKD